MLKYFLYNVIFLLLAIPLGFVSWNHPYGLVWMILYFLLYLSGLVFGSMNVCSGFYIDVICRSHPETNAIALTFDDGPNEIHTEKILDLLKKHQVTACFFTIGERAEARPEIIKKIHKEGHIIGNHSFSHAFWFDLFPLKKMKSEIIETNNVIDSIIGKNMRFFRPPYGVTTPTLAKAIRRTGMIPVGWSLRTMDTVAKGKTQKILKKLENVKPGNIILFHDHVEELPEVLEKFIVDMKEKKIKILRLDDLLNIKAYYE